MHVCRYVYIYIPVWGVNTSILVDTFGLPPPSPLLQQRPREPQPPRASPRPPVCPLPNWRGQPTDRRPTCLPIALTTLKNTQPAVFQNLTQIPHFQPSSSLYPHRTKSNGGPCRLGPQPCTQPWVPLASAWLKIPGGPIHASNKYDPQNVAKRRAKVSPNFRSPKVLHAIFFGTFTEWGVDPRLEGVRWD